MPVRRTVHRQPPRPLRSSLRWVRVHERKLGVPWHYHPEYQLTLLLPGDGQRGVGDSIAPVTDGDLTLLHASDRGVVFSPAVGQRVAADILGLIAVIS